MWMHLCVMPSSLNTSTFKVTEQNPVHSSAVNFQSGKNKLSCFTFSTTCSKKETEFSDTTPQPVPHSARSAKVSPSFVFSWENYYIYINI